MLNKTPESMLVQTLEVSNNLIEIKKTLSTKCKSKLHKGYDSLEKIIFRRIKVVFHQK